MSGRTFRGTAILCLALTPSFLTNCTRDPAAREARYLKRGKEMLEKKDYSHAIIEFTNAAKVMPKDAEAHYWLGVALLDANRMPQAVKSFRAATQLNPNHAGAQVKLAELMIASRSQPVLQDAEKRMTDVVAAAPENPDANRALAIAEFKLGKPDEAEQRLTSVLERFPANLKTAGSLAALKMSKRDFAGAETVLKNVVAQTPRSEEAGIALAHFYVATGQLPKAEAEVTRVLTLNANSAAALLLRGAFEMQRNNVADAERTYQKIAALPNSPYPYIHGAFLLGQKRNDEALAEFAALAKANPKDRQARTRLIQAQLVLGKTADAERELEAALKSNPKDRDALLQRSRILLAAGRFQDAEKDLRAVVQLSPDSADAHYGLAKVYAASAAESRAREELAEALRLRPDALTIRAELSRALIVSGAAKAALDLLEGAPAFQKSDAQFTVARNWALIGLGRRDEARAAIEAELRRASRPELLFQRAVLSFDQKDYAAAQTDADVLLRDNPLHLRALDLAVQSRLQRKQRAEAEQLVRDTAARKTDSPELQSAAGNWLLALGKSSDARSRFEAALANRPNYAPAAISMARLDVSAGRSEDARKRLTTLLQAAPRDGSVLMSFGDLEYGAGNRTQAADYYRRAAESDRRNYVALNNYAYLRAEADPDDAFKYAQQALELSPNSAMVLDTLGWIYYRKGMYDSAVDQLQRAMSIEPSAKRQFHLGMAQMKLGRKDAAAANLSAALKADSRLPATESGW